MLDKIIPKKIIYLCDLIRLNKPIGFLLLMWPCWFALAIISNKNFELLFWYLIFLIGSFLMRSAGCIINDIIDINIDKNITRTAKRPLTSKNISILEALFFLLFLLTLSFFILLQFNFQTILIGFISIPLIIIYPFLKRYTYWPQLGLGLVFSWGVIIVAIQFIGFISFNFVLLYLGCIFWTLGYDTVYAYQDREDDIKNNIKSTAVLFDFNGKKYVKFFYTIFFMIVGFLGYNSSQSFISLIVIILTIFGINLFLNKWQLDSKESSNYYFKFNNIIGFFCFVFLFIF